MGGSSFSKNHHEVLKTIKNKSKVTGGWEDENNELRRIVVGIGNILTKSGCPINTTLPVPKLAAEIIKTMKDISLKEMSKYTEEEKRIKCVEIAKYLNDEMGSSAKPIDLSQDSMQICQDILMTLEDLTGALGKELVMAKGAIEEILDRLALLHNIIININPDSQKCKKVRQKIIEELDKQTNSLRTALNLKLKPVGEMFKKETELSKTRKYKYLKSLQIEVGECKYVDMLLLHLKNLGSTAKIAAVLDSALKTVGLELSKYYDAQNWGEIDALIEEAKGKISDDKLVEFEKAASFLKKNFHEKISGGDEDIPYAEKIARENLDIQTTTIAFRRDVITKYLRDFHNLYGLLAKELRTLSPLLGDKIPIDLPIINIIYNSLDSYIGFSNSKTKELAYVKFYEDKNSYQERELFIEALQKMIDNCKSVLDSYKSFFKKLCEIMEKMQALINKTTTIVEKSFSEHGRFTLEELKLDDSLISSLVDSFRAAINAFKFFRFIGSIHKNLDISAGEMKELRASQHLVLADAIAGKQESITLKYEADLKMLNHLFPDTNAEKNNVKELLKRKYRTKREFYKALEALEIYLFEFSDAIIRNPEEIKDIRKILDGVVINSKWFTDHTGDNITEVFESFKDIFGNVSAVMGQGGNHYYEKVLASLQANRFNVGSIFPTSIQDLEQLIVKLQNVVNSFHAMKNIFSAFARIGDKFKETSVSSRVFMPLPKMFNTLKEYLIFSTIDIFPGIYATVLGEEPNAEPNRAYKVIKFNIAGNNVTVTKNTKEGKSAIFLNIIGKNRGDWETEDFYFAKMMKAVSAKILVVIGVYELLNRPNVDYDIASIRTIIGGLDTLEETTTPDVLEEAAEHYYRIPRLLELYKDLFEYNEDIEKKISMIPSLNNEWDKLIKLVFIRGNNEGNYNLGDQRVMVREINQIYLKYNDCKNALRSLIKTINSKYGMIRKDKYTAALDRIRKEYRDARLDPLEAGNNEDYAQNYNYSLIPDEESDVYSKPSLSDQYYKVGPINTTTLTKFSNRPGKHNIDSEFGEQSQWAILSSFRKLFNRKYNSREMKERMINNEVVFESTRIINYVKKELKGKTSRESRFDSAASLIGPSDKISKETSEIFNFHEMVVFPLDVLHIEVLQLEEFLDRVETEYNIVSAQEEILRIITRPAAGGNSILQDRIAVAGAGGADRAYFRGMLGGKIDGAFVNPNDNTILQNHLNAEVAVPARTYAQLWGFFLAAGAVDAKLPVRYLINHQALMKRFLADLYNCKCIDIRFPNQNKRQLSVTFKISMYSDFLDEIKN